MINGSPSFYDMIGRRPTIEEAYRAGYCAALESQKQAYGPREMYVDTIRTLRRLVNPVTLALDARILEAVKGNPRYLFSLASERKKKDAEDEAS